MPPMRALPEGEPCDQPRLILPRGDLLALRGRAAQRGRYRRGRELECQLVRALQLVSAVACSSRCWVMSP